MEIVASDQAENILEKCIANRSQADTLLNSNSSRSHTIFRIVVKSTYQSTANKFINESSLCIVDLAGSERAKRTENVGNQMVEACNINKSLLVLGRCLKSLKEAQTGAGSNVLVPYRDSKLTRILYEYFHEENNLRMIANINPRQADFEESMRVLNYAAIAKDIQPIKSRIDNSRKLLFPLANKDLQRSRTDDGLSNFSGEDSLLNFKGIFDDKENLIINGRDSFGGKKPSFFNPQPDEKDIKIKVLEGNLITKKFCKLMVDMVVKLNEKIYLNDVTSRLNNVNDNFKQSMRSFFSSEKNSISKALDSFSVDSTNFSCITIIQTIYLIIIGQRDLNSFHLQNSFSDLQNRFSHQIRPLNVNYFLFKGSLEENNIHGLQKIFNIPGENVHRQPSILPEVVRSEAQDKMFQSNQFSEKPESNFLHKNIEIKEEAEEGNKCFFLFYLY